MAKKNEIQIIISAIVDKAIAGLNKADDALDEVGDSANKSIISVDGFTSAVTGLNQALEVVNKIMNAAKEVHDQTVGVFIDYAKQVRDMSRATGESAENSSRLIQMADDLGISYEQLKLSSQMAARQGIDVSIESLKSLSDEYLNLVPGTERMQFLLDRFGRSGADMGKLLEVGAEGLQKLNDEVESGLILSGAILKRARAHEILTDALNDEIEAQKILAGITIGGIEDSALLERAVRTRMETMMEEEAITQQRNLTDQERKKFILQNKEAVRRQILAEVDAKSAFTDTTAAIDDQIDAQEELSKKMSEISFGIAGKPTEIMDDYKEKVANLTEEEGKLRGELDLAISQGWWPTSEKVQGLTQDLEDNISKQGEAEEAMRRATSELIYQQIASGLDSEASLALAESLGLLDQPSYDLAVTLDDLNKKYEEGKIDLDQYKEAVGLARDAVIDADGTTAAMKVTTYLDTIINGVANDWKTGHKSGFQSGGSFTVPGSGSGDRPFLMGLEPGEGVTVTSRNRVGAGFGSGSGLNLNIHIHSAMNLVDRNYLQNELMPYIEAGVRRLQGARA